MYHSQAPYRELVESLDGYEGEQVFAEVLAPWLAAHGGEGAWLAALATRPGTPFPPADDEDVCRLYALSRVFDTLLNQFQLTDSDDPSSSGWLSDGLTAGEFARFAEGLGLTVAGDEPFTPFLHEIVAAEAASGAGESIAITGTLWPALMLGEMLVLRGGVRVRGGSDRLDPAVAATSPLYWAWRRPHRAAVDRSQGWGGNSQWRTGFRRDYRIGGTEYLNVDGDDDATRLGPDDPDYLGLAPERWVELVRHRCLLGGPAPGGEAWPFGLRLTLYPPPHLPGGSAGRSGLAPPRPAGH